MPINGQCGFVFLHNVSAEGVARVAAHELGHGVFRLYHTFSSDNRYILPEGTTDNLMDYNGGTALYKYQWDYIHNPQTMLFAWAEEEEEGAMGLPCMGWFDECDDVLKILETIRNARISGNQIKIKGQTKTDVRTLTANLVKIGGTEYKRIRLIYKPNTKDYSFNPTQYVDYNQQFLLADGTIDWQRGIVYYKNKEELLKIIVDDEFSKIDKLKEYLFGKEYDEIKAIIVNNSVLTPERIKEVREQIEMLKDENQKKELYLELQAKVPYHNQRNNNQTQYIADRMCNLTSEAMCLEYLGISCPNPNMQFEDYLEQIRADNNYGDRTTPIARQKLAEFLGACYDKKDYGNTFSIEKERLINFVLIKLQSGCAIMISVWPACKGHLVRLQNITEEGLIIDDPYGKVTDFMSRENCESGGYNINSNTEEDSKGKDNLWRWSDIKDVTIKYVEVYCKCK